MSLEEERGGNYIRGSERRRGRRRVEVEVEVEAQRREREKKGIKIIGVEFNLKIPTSFVPSLPLW